MNYAGESRRNHARANLVVNCAKVSTGNWDVTDGLVTDVDPGFVNAEQQNFRLREDSAIFKDSRFRKDSLRTDRTATGGGFA